MPPAPEEIRAFGSDLKGVVERTRNISCEDALRLAVAALEGLVTLAASQAATIDVLVAHLKPRPATGLHITIRKEQPMGTVNISIDDKTGKVGVVWTDDKGDTDAAAPDGPDGNPVTVTFTSSDTSQIVVNPDDTLSVVATNDQGAPVEITATVTNSDGTPAVWPIDAGAVAGQPITAEAAAIVKVVAGAAEGLSIEVQA